jgi:hypothetical protein
MSFMAALRIEIVKRPDGAGVLRCMRDDGSVTWQKQSRHAAVFALHDLTHFAVEQTLGYRHGFFGLIRQGWDTDDTGGKGARGPLPPEAMEVERIVGAFDSERNVGVLWSTEEFEEHAQQRLTAEQIQSVRRLRSDLFQKWAAVPPGGKLELTFDPA